MKNYRILVSYRKMINEVGDLEKVESYPLTAYNKFKTEEGLEVEMGVGDLGEYRDAIRPLPPSWDREIIYFGFTVNGKESQAKKTDYRTLVRILKTVVSFLERYLKTHSDIDAVLIGASPKEERNILTGADPQKTALYHAILLKRMTRQGSKWSFKECEVAGIKAFYIYRKR